MTDKSPSEALRAILLNLCMAAQIVKWAHDEGKHHERQFDDLELQIKKAETLLAATPDPAPAVVPEVEAWSVRVRKAERVTDEWFGLKQDIRRRVIAVGAAMLTGGDANGDSTDTIIEAHRDAIEAAVRGAAPLPDLATADEAVEEAWALLQRDYYSVGGEARRTGMEVAVHRHRIERAALAATSQSGATAPTGLDALNADKLERLHAIYRAYAHDLSHTAGAVKEACLLGIALAAARPPLAAADGSGES